MGRKSLLDEEINVALQRDNTLIKAVDKLTEKASADQLGLIIKFLQAKKRKMK